MLTKRVLESLIFAGAFDSLGYARRALIENQDKVSGPILAERKAEAAGQFSLFGGDSGVTEVDESVLDGEEFDKRTLLREEKEVLGQFVTDHPLLGVQDLLAAQTTHEIGDLESLGDGDLVTIGGIIGARATQVHEAERAVRAVPAGGARRRHAGHGVPVDLRGRARV